MQKCTARKHNCTLHSYSSMYKSLPNPDEATVKKFAAFLQGDTTVLFQWHADVNLTQDGIAFSSFHLTRLRQGFVEEVGITLSLRDAQCPNSAKTKFCYEWEGFAAGVSYSVWIEMVYSYPATGGRVDLIVTIPGIYICVCVCTCNSIQKCCM